MKLCDAFGIDLVVHCEAPQKLKSAQKVSPTCNQKSSSEVGPTAGLPPLELGFGRQVFIQVQVLVEVWVLYTNN